MTRATSSPTLDSAITLADGRQLAYAEWGDPRGKPVVFIHGMPASRLFCPDEDATIAAGVRLITIDRPGYGRSDPRPSRALLDWPTDFVELADHLDLPPCPVIGWSAGGRNALAIGSRVPERVSAIGVAVAPGPIDQVPGAIEDLDPEERAAFALLGSDRAAGLALITEQSRWLDGDGWKTMFAGSWGESDDDVLSDPATREAMEAQTREGARQGRAGYEADLLEAFTPWGFSVADIGHSVHVWSGGSDPGVGPNHAAYLAATIPNATLVTYPGEGHLIPIRHWDEMLAAFD
jgi:pimeloyl-ACP methyl ester carboxylesterase